MRNYQLLSTVFGLLSLSVVACGSGTQSDDDGSDPGTVNPGANQAAPDAAVPPGCDVTKTPSQDACVVNETLGVFVAPPSADASVDSPDGTRAHPFAKMQDAIDAAKNQKKRVYACIGSYAEQITITDGVSMFGNLDCNQGWSVVSGKHASVNSPASPAAHADQITTPTRVEAIDLVAPDGTAQSPSSVALIATAAPALTIANATVHAGAGAKGADGIEGAQLSNSPSANGANGVHEYEESASFPICSSIPASSNTCVGAPGYAGGAGGAGGWGGHYVVSRPSGGFASVYEFELPSGVACSALRPCVCAATLGGANPTATASTAQGAYNAGGADPGPRAATAGVAGAYGAPGASGVASFSTDGGLHVIEGDGIPGGDGAPGQGGGGGMGIVPQPGGYADGTNLIGGAGASGGAGGCPGLAGTAGKGGGASIAILASDSPLTLDTCIVQASNAGDGGKGTFGSDPTPGGQPGMNYEGTFNSAGAAGGAGGASGWSGSGAGGSSIDIAFHGAPVVLVSTVPTSGGAGKGVPAMTLGAKTIPATPAGVSGLSVSF